METENCCISKRRVLDCRYPTLDNAHAKTATECWAKEVISTVTASTIALKSSRFGDLNVAYAQAVFTKCRGSKSWAAPHTVGGWGGGLLAQPLDPPKLHYRASLDLSCLSFSGIAGGPRKLAHRSQTGRVAEGIAAQAAESIALYKGIAEIQMRGWGIASFKRESHATMGNRVPNSLQKTLPPLTEVSRLWVAPAPPLSLAFSRCPGAS